MSLKLLNGALEMAEHSKLLAAEFLDDLLSVQERLVIQQHITESLYIGDQLQCHLP